MSWIPTRKSYRQNGKVLGPPNRPGAWGLKIIPPKGQEFYSVERAITGKGDTLNDVNEDAFYEHIGAPKSESSSPESSPLTTTLSVEAGTNSTSKASEASANAANGAPLKICGSMYELYETSLWEMCKMHGKLEWLQSAMLPEGKACVDFQSDSFQSSRISPSYQRCALRYQSRQRRNPQ